MTHPWTMRDPLGEEMSSDNPEAVWPRAAEFVWAGEACFEHARGRLVVPPSVGERVRTLADARDRRSPPQPPRTGRWVVAVAAVILGAAAALILGAAATLISGP